MFPPSNSDNPFESLFKRSSFNPSDQNPSSKQELDHHDPPFFFNFPSPFFDENELPLNQILLQNHPMNSNPKKKEEQKEMVQKEMVQRRRNLGTIPRRRTGKKDRHSKICTAQGIRDRRMRLSLQVARKFFDLQDMLGYDKASKTIEWLFSKSKRAIRELTKDHPQAQKGESFVSECEVVSVSKHDFNAPAENYVKSCETKPASKSNMRESRDKARERARSRTKEKMMIKNMENSGQWCNIKSNPNDNQHNLDDKKLGFSNIQFEAVDQESKTHNQESVFPYGSADYNSYEDVGTIEKLLGSSNSSSSNSGYVDPNSDFMTFLGNWDVFNCDRTNYMHFAVTNQVSLPGNPSSSFLDTPKFQ
ncbi:hypothetical protein CDL12_26483 [Handroanthus impetiginosus]|uniref:TCP domain-containing protein n=1 Tax=Handroanthus impetiginosus TaxID=429701 RepID=A0A2G9G733_9LAMI|nr:hypothetical protein CDL12_26483 [Handroanthus impetiginosus]